MEQIWVSPLPPCPAMLITTGAYKTLRSCSSIIQLGPMFLSFTPIISVVMHIMHHNKWSLLKIDKQNVMFSLRYYATFKVRKFESLFCKTNAFLQKTATCIELQAKANILCKYMIYTFFQLWAWLLRFLFHVISKSPSILW